jgi:hypothetical protein
MILVTLGLVAVAALGLALPLGWPRVYVVGGLLAAGVLTLAIQVLVGFPLERKIAEAKAGYFAKEGARGVQYEDVTLVGNAMIQVRYTAWFWLWVVVLLLTSGTVAAEAAARFWPATGPPTTLGP